MRIKNIFKDKIFNWDIQIKILINYLHKILNYLL